MGLSFTKHEEVKLDLHKIKPPKEDNYTILDPNTRKKIVSPIKFLEENPRLDHID